MSLGGSLQVRHTSFEAIDFAARVRRLFIDTLFETSRTVYLYAFVQFILRSEVEGTDEEDARSRIVKCQLVLL